MNNYRDKFRFRFEGRTWNISVSLASMLLDSYKTKGLYALNNGRGGDVIYFELRELSLLLALGKIVVLRDYHDFARRIAREYPVFDAAK